MRILFGTPSRLDPRLGASQILLNLANACRELGHEVVIREPPPAAAAAPWFFRMRRLRADFALFARRSEPFDLADSFAWMSSPALRRGARRVCVRSVQPDLAYLDRAATPSRRSLPWRLAARLHERDTRRLTTRGWHGADRVLALGGLERDWMERAFPRLRSRLDSYVVAPSERDRARLREIAARRSASPDAAENARLLWIGRWSSHKGTIRLIEFAAGFLGAHRKASLTVAGTGEDAVGQFPGELIVSGRVRVVPAFEREELFALLERHDAGLFTSDVEGWGLSVQEMLESGLPVYATDAGAVPDVKPWFGTQLRPFPPRSGEAFPQRIGDDGFAAYADRFSWPRIARDYLRSAMAGEERR